MKVDELTQAFFEHKLCWCAGLLPVALTNWMHDVTDAKPPTTVTVSHRTVHGFKKTNQLKLF
jgi:hypothetical protein